MELKMIKAFLSVAVMLLGISVLCAEESNLLSSLPEYIGGMKKGKITDYGKPGLGSSVRYNGPGGIGADIYVYSLGDKDITDGCESEKVKKAFEKAYSEIQEMEKRGNIKGLKETMKGDIKISCLAGKELKMLQACFNYDMLLNMKTDQSAEAAEPQALPVFSTLLLTGYKGDYLKIRYTCPLQLKNSDALFGLFITSLGKHLYDGEKTNVDESLKEIVYSSMKTLEENPSDEGSQMAAQALLKFTEDSPDVIVILDERVLAPIITAFNREDKAQKEKLDILIASFLGGNAKAQLEKDICTDMPLAGAVSMIKTYKALKKADASMSVPLIEKMIESDGKGELEKYLKSLTGEK